MASLQVSGSQKAEDIAAAIVVLLPPVTADRLNIRVITVKGYLTEVRMWTIMKKAV
jgi:hypothetical protein